MNKTLATLILLLFLINLQGCIFRSAPRLVTLSPTVCQDRISGQMWQIPKSTRAENLEEAQAIIAKLNESGEHKDWRLPTLIELYNLNNLIDLHQSGDCPIDPEGKYWSGEKDGEGVAGAWEIADQCDPERQYFTDTRGAVRAVRP